MKTILLNNADKIEMPIVGLGTWRAEPDEIKNAVLAALDCGYRHIDTAFSYNNEEAIGNALKEWFTSGKGKRTDVFVTTKLPCVGNRAEDVEKFLKLSLERLQLEYLDLYLIHAPFAFKCESNFIPQLEGDGSFVLDMNDNVLTWKAMEEQVKKGLCRSIGLSNFNAKQLQNIYKASEIKPAVLQIELHAYLQQRELVKLCQQLSIAVTAYSPLGSPGANTHFNTKYNYSLSNFPDILGNFEVNEIAQKHNKTPGQILLKHLIQQDVAVIPKSSNPNRIKQNINIFDFELSAEELKILDSLDKGENGRIFNFLFFKGVEKHPEYPFVLKSRC
ncbi:hypothetical protein RN001_001282 [Aquatica leii]|uniref:NADP-dependent oxidoreductase domain-containing protein n=1 Tax=Aquatica leii TaxID=1421715 RepID=A0AAN7PL22_9COLE|nr:hypothetical protein RN001_001282 [Aquatica leii]